MGTEQGLDVTKLVTDCVIEIIEIRGSEINEKANDDLIKLIMKDFPDYEKVVTDNDGKKLEIDDIKTEKKLKELVVGSKAVVCKFYRKGVNLCIPWGIPRSELCKGVNGEVVCKLQLVKAIEGNIFDECFITCGNVKFLLQHYSKKYQKDGKYGVDGVAEYLRKEFVTKFSEIIEDCFKTYSDKDAVSLEQRLQNALQLSIKEGTELNELFNDNGIFEPKVTVNGFVELKKEGG